MAKSADSFTFTVGKLDAGMAILLGERAHLIEFPSILLPPGTTAGSIVSIAVHQNYAEEKRRDEAFWSLQDAILEEFGHKLPEPPLLRVRNVTQTSVTLEWAPLELATSKLRSLDIYRNGQRLASIPSPHTNTSTKLSGLQIDTEYTFQLILRTTAGTFPSALIKLQTHTMNDTSGIVVCFGAVPDEELLERSKEVLGEMGARWSDKIQIDTSHFVCSTPKLAPGQAQTGPQAIVNFAKALGVEYQRALQLSIPTVQPSWIMACQRDKRMIPVGGHYLGTTPHSAPILPITKRPQSVIEVPSSSRSPAPAEKTQEQKLQNRASMPPSVNPTRTPPGGASSFVNQDHQQQQARGSSTAIIEPTPEEDGEDAGDAGASTMSLTSKEGKRKSIPGVMNKDFRFPPTSPSPSNSLSHSTPPALNPVTEGQASVGTAGDSKANIISPASIEVPAPPVVEKEVDPRKGRPSQGADEEGDEDVGDTVEISLN